MPELLLELLSEEIPARMQVRAAEDLKRLVKENLKRERLDFKRIETYVTPRRLVLVVDGLPTRIEGETNTSPGPRVDATEQAIQGFMRKHNVKTIDELEIEETSKGKKYVVTKEIPATDVVEILPTVISVALSKLPWPKSMRWGAELSLDELEEPWETLNRTWEETGKPKWVRPLRGIVFIFDGKIVRYGYGRVAAGDTTTGHSFLSPGEITVTDFADYKKKLEKAHVVLDPADRRTAIEAGAKKLAKKEGLALKDDPGLLDEVTGLVEWPVVLMGSIDEAFMELPDEVLTTVMRHHQKYFALLDKNGALAPRFIVVANTETVDKGKTVVAGNERVLRARLADARFFWDQDLKQTLESRVQELGGRVFHAKLGTVLDKVLRVEQLAGELAGACGADAGDAMRAANLAKADLSTEMVAEFPELQGVIGRYYALSDGEKPEVADAIADHYSPLGPGDACPQAPISVTVALADKIDTLVGFWAAGEKPTGSKDPFALRRAALGVIRVILENGLRVPLAEAFGKSKAAFDEMTGGLKGGFDAADLLDFFADRLKVHLREKGVRHDHIDAVFAVQKPGGGKEDDLVRLLKRVEALGAFLGTDDGENLLVAYKRAANIVRIEEKNDGKSYDSEVDEKLLELKEEKSLHKELKSTAPNIAQALKDENFHAAMGLLAGLRKPVDDFFDHVTVNCEDAKLRENRLRLLSEISSALDDVADFSKIEGGER